MIFVLICLISISQIWRCDANSGVGQKSIVESVKPIPVVPVPVAQPAPFAPANGGFVAAALPPEAQFYQHGAAMAPLAILGSPCADNFTCTVLPNSYCGFNRTCQCMINFVEDPVFTGTCRLAPGYNELCAVGETECRQPFVCNASSMCDCKPGYLQEYFQCVKDCPSGQVPVGDGCMPARQLEEKCETNEQCMQSFSQCLHNKCQCIPGTNQLNGHCYPVNQCPLGEPGKDKRGKVQTCTADNEEVCAKDFYCLHAEVGSQNGFCCPKIKMNCPIGQPLEGHNCTNCPWETHHCFSYVIGSYTETMCCPNACPAGHPIQKDGKCYAKSAYRGHCMVDEQCYNVLGSTCRKDKDSKTRCLCPEGNFKNYFGRCLREAGLGEDCTTNEECRQGTNTVCSNGVCTCFNGYIPEPIKARSPAASATPQRCIAEPSCPTPAGLKPMDGYAECTEDAKVCKENEFCRRWWNEANHTYSLCCTKPKLSDYEAMCKPFRMKLMSSPKKAEPLRCDITSVPQPLLVAHEATANGSSPLLCPPTASCLFDPYSIDKGICCKADEINAQGAPIPIGQHPLAPVAAVPPPVAASPNVGSSNKIQTTTASGSPTNGSRTVAPVAPNANTTQSNGNGNNSGAKKEESEEENSGEGVQKSSTPSVLPTSTASGNRPNVANSSTPANQAPAKANSGGSNIPVVRIRGFNNNNQG